MKVTTSAYCRAPGAFLFALAVPRSRRSSRAAAAWEAIVRALPLLPGARRRRDEQHPDQARRHRHSGESQLRQPFRDVSRSGRHDEREKRPRCRRAIRASCSPPIMKPTSVPLKEVPLAARLDIDHIYSGYLKELDRGKMDGFDLDRLRSERQRRARLLVCVPVRRTQPTSRRTGTSRSSTCWRITRSRRKAVRASPRIKI